MDVEIKYNSPLQYLDYDVSRYIYETYFPLKITKEWKNLVNDQFKYFNQSLSQMKLLHFGQHLLVELVH